MINSDTILGWIVTAMRSNATLLALLNNDPSNVIAAPFSYPDGVDLMSEVASMKPPSILVAQMGVSIEKKLSHKFSAFLFPAGSTPEMFAALRNGTPAGSSVPFKRMQLSPQVHILEMTGWERKALVFDVSRQFEYAEAPIVITETSVDA